MKWETIVLKKPTIHEPILLEGLPGIGNVGKIVMDYLIEKTKAEKILSFYSHALPNSVFITQNNLVELPKLELYHVIIKRQHFLLLTGDVQPSNEEASYSFCEEVVSLLLRYKTKYVVTFGGIGLNEIPEKPIVYITGTSKKIIDSFQDVSVEKKIYGVVGPIMGISGLLLGISQKHQLPAASLLAETFGHPIYLGLKGAREIIMVLNKHYHFDISLDDLEKEIKAMDAQLKDNSKQKKPTKFEQKYQHRQVNYIG